MAQIKKAEVRKAIIHSAYKLFKNKGYVSTTTAQIAAGAGISESNVYVYFKSKYQILLELYEEWLRERIVTLQNRLLEINDPREQLRLVLTTLWQKLPSDDNGFTNNLVQALSTLQRSDSYRPHLLRWIEQSVETIILSIVEKERRKTFMKGQLVHILMMAQDGFALNFHLDPQSRCHDDTIELMCDLILGERPTMKRPTRRS